MPLTIAQIAAELGIDQATLASKQEIISRYDNQIAGFETSAANAQNTLNEAQRIKAQAETLQATIDQNIANFGINESTTIKLKAQLEAVKAAAKVLEEQGGTKLDLNLPDFSAQAPVDPVKNLESLIVRGFTNINQTTEANNRHIALYGKPMPDAPSVLADEAAQMRMPVLQWADQKYKLTAKAQEIQAAAQKDHETKLVEKAIQEYKEKNPSYAGNPELNGGFPSNFSQVPAPRDGKTVREFSGMSTREKIQNAMSRARDAVASSSGKV